MNLVCELAPIHTGFNVHQVYAVYDMEELRASDESVAR